MAFAPSLVSKFPILDVPRESLSCGSCPAEMDRTGWF